MVNKSCSLLGFFLLTCAVISGHLWTTVFVQWNIDVWCDRPICSGAYANNVRLMYTSVAGHIVDCSEIL